MVDIIPKNLIIIFLIIIAFIILFSFLTFLMSIKPGKWPIEFTPESFNLKYEDVDFETSDGLKLKERMEQVEFWNGLLIFCK